MTNYIASIESLLDKVADFNKLSDRQKAAFRANLTKCEKAVKEAKDEQMASIVNQIREIAGEAPAKAAKKLTPADIKAEYEKSYLSKNVKERTAFKAKLTRMINSAIEAKDTKAEKELTALRKRMESEAKAARMKRVLAKAAKLKAN